MIQFLNAALGAAVAIASPPGSRTMSRGGDGRQFKSLLRETNFKQSGVGPRSALPTAARKLTRTGDEYSVRVRSNTQSCFSAGPSCDIPRVSQSPQKPENFKYPSKYPESLLALVALDFPPLFCGNGSSKQVVGISTEACGGRLGNQSTWGCWSDVGCRTIFNWAQSSGTRSTTVLSRQELTAVESIGPTVVAELNIPWPI